MRELWKSFSDAFQGRGKFITFGLAGAAALLFFSAIPAAAESKESKEEKDQMQALIKAAGYICRERCKEENERFERTRKKYYKNEKKLEKAKESAAAGKPHPDQDKMERETTEAWAFYEKAKGEFVECLTRCRDESPEEREKAEAQGEDSSFYQDNKTMILVGGGAAAVVLGAAAVSGGGGDGAGGGGDGTALTAEEITGTYALSGNRSSGDCPGFGPTINNSGVSIVGSNGMVSIFSSAEIRGSLGSDGSFRGEGSFMEGSCTIRETVEGRFTRDSSGRIVFTGTLTFDDDCHCTVSYSVTYTKL